VKPGNGTVPKGEDVTIDAILSGFDPERADIKSSFREQFQLGNLLHAGCSRQGTTYRYRIFNIQDAVHYYVSAGGRRSDEFTLKVATFPKLKNWTITYHSQRYRPGGQERRECVRS